MRKIILIAAMVLASASAQAGGSRSLSLAALNDATPAQQVATTTPVAASAVTMSEAAPVTEAPKYVDRPSAVSTAPPAPATTSTPSVAPTPAADAAKPAPKTAKAGRVRHKDSWTASRIIGELHRHGIYW